MSEESKKKIMIKRKGSAKPAIRLNKRPDDEEATPSVEEAAPAVDAAGRKKVAFKKPMTTKPPVKKTDANSEQAKTAEPIPAKESAVSSPEKQETPKLAAKPSEGDPAKTEKVEGTVFKFYCVYCGQKLSAYDTMAGKKITCPSCQNKIEIPVPPT